jgi:hypothetical protein
MDELYFDDWGTGSDLNAGDVLKNVTPDTVAPVTTSGSSWLTDLIKGAGTVATEVAKYKKATLPNGASIYTRIDPRTGLPIANQYTVAGSGVSGFISQNLPLILIGGVAIYFLTRGK